MKHTDNLNLALYEGADKMNVTGDTDSLNANMVAIDGALAQMIPVNIANGNGIGLNNGINWGDNNNRMGIYIPKMNLCVWGVALNNNTGSAITGTQSIATIAPNYRPKKNVVGTAFINGTAVIAYIRASSGALMVQFGNQSWANGGELVMSMIYQNL